MMWWQIGQLHINCYRCNVFREKQADRKIHILDIY